MKNFIQKIVVVIIAMFLLSNNSFAQTQTATPYQSIFTKIYNGIYCGLFPDDCEMINVELKNTTNSKSFLSINITQPKRETAAYNGPAPIYTGDTKNEIKYITVEGTKGESGPAGEKGAQGEKGQDAFGAFVPGAQYNGFGGVSISSGGGSGATGATGPAGASGAAGISGVNGLNGATGTNGLSGATGTSVVSISATSSGYLYTFSDGSTQYVSAPPSTTTVASTSNDISTTTNTFISIVNGISSAVIKFINFFTQSVSGNILTTNINGVIATTSIISSNNTSFSTSTNILTTSVNGVVSTTSIPTSAGGGAAATTTYSNGVTLAPGNTVQLGGSLNSNTNINLSNNNLTTSGTGNVGIGTNAPGNKLTIYADTASSSGLRFDRLSFAPTTYSYTIASNTAIRLGSTGAYPIDIATDNAGNVFTTNITGNTITKITPGGVSSVFANINSPTGLKIDRFNNLYVVSASLNDLYKIDSSGVVATITSNTMGLAGQDLEIDSIGDFYISNYTSQNISKVTAAGVSTIFNFFGAVPYYMIFDSSDNLYVTDPFTGNITKIDQGGTGVIFANVPSANDIAIDSNQNLYVTSSNGNITKITPGGVTSLVSIVPGIYNILIDSSNNIFITASSSLKAEVVQVFQNGATSSLGLTDSYPRSITKDVGGNLYTGNADSRTVTKITPGYIVTRPKNKFLTVNTSGDVVLADAEASSIALGVGDIRVGDSGSNGCVQNFAGTGLVGTCSSDERLKTNIKDLNTKDLQDKFSKIRFVEYNWNNVASDVYKKSQIERVVGVLAQNVEEQFPELIKTDRNGYKTVDLTTLNWYGLGSLQNSLKELQDLQKSTVKSPFSIMAKMLESNAQTVNSPINFVNFISPDGKTLGSITQNQNGGVSYNTVSDARLKENVVESSKGLNELMNIQVKDFNFIADDKKLAQTGFIAQNLAKIIPEAVSTNGDNGENPLNTGDNPWQADYGRLTPVLVKSLQELNNKVFGSNPVTTVSIEELTASNTISIDTKLRALGTNALQVKAFMESLASSTAATSTNLLSIDGQSEIKDTFAGSVWKATVGRMIGWLADTSNGIGKIFAKELNTEKLCIKKADNTLVCVTGDELQAAIVDKSKQNASSTNNISNTIPSIEINLNQASSTATNTIPIIEINLPNINSSTTTEGAGNTSP